MVREFGMNPKVWGFESSPTGRDIFCLKNFDTCTKTSIRVSKMNAVAHAQLRFQVLTWLQNPLLYSMVTYNLIWSLAAVGHI